ncbi:methyltransferase domain-containing protein [Longimicrobium terrae]|uniref:Ubiquinone/menaquinone biosynthesis C-methylase UbiE n=1 Tax=Longimicrobium terrae TaxID=1639882 RepID=A0A841GPQ6_9BACT|nr:ubiquinone/menaquinone biosynthesis C-methylase UbiE [Longimicrobium terrae]MBB6068960.1 ubiquinone/menaquinone biosynthesis C-methylase UbiE [Longimicrobium terrae]NNC28139.1 methyltransferase domain-containing protein [Longimicrobium terrae]
MTSLPRSAGAERMDEPGQDAAELARSLADLRGVNRWLGGTRVVLHHLRALVDAEPPRRWRILDVATGSADIPLAIARWARARGTRVEIVATDLHPTTLAVARERVAGIPDVRAEAADALALPYKDGAFDVVICSTALHHFDDPADVAAVLREMGRVGRVGGIVNDLRRSRPALLGANLLAATVWRTHPVTRHDGPLSVRRAFTPAELMDAARAAGLAGARVHTHAPFRVALTWRGERT